MLDYIRVKCSLSRRFGKRMNKTLLVTLVIAIIIFFTINAMMNSVQIDAVKSNYKIILSENVEKANTEKSQCKILLWTTFFGSMTWYSETKNVYKHVCPHECVITKDKTEIASATVVIFHLADIAWQGQLTSGFSFSFPSYRHPDQIWILYNLEPLTMLWGNMGAWQGVFNWTMSYTRDSDVYTPYGAYRKLTENEIKTETRNGSVLNNNHFSSKTENGGIAMISHCSDEAERYKIIKYLSQYIDTKIVGRCGEKCPGDFQSCDKLLSKYQFYLAFENSDCKDYVTEKYWRSLKHNQIPIVAWRTPIRGIVIPGSFINVYDFENFEDAGSYIQKVAGNETLYNSYFQWKFFYTLETGNRNSHFCTLADTLEKKYPRMFYHNMYGWIHNNTCKPVTVRTSYHFLIREQK